MKQYMLVEKRPGLGKNDYHVAGNMAFNTLAAAENSRRGRIEGLARAGVRNEHRELAIVEFDVNAMVGPSPWRERVRWAWRFVFSGYKWRMAVISREEWQAFASARDSEK